VTPARRGEHEITIDAARRDIAQAFRQHGLDSPELDARLIVGHALGLDHAGLVAQSNRPVSAADADVIAALAERRLKHEPVARILGTKEFWGLRLELNAETLVPRPETETVVEAALAAIDRSFDRQQPLRLADLGTGFWVAPSLLADRAEPNTLQFRVLLDFGRDIPPGQRQLQMSAVDSTGRYGPLREIPLYFGATQPSGAAVASLTWDSNADLDLQIVTPTGTIDAKHVSAGSFVDGGFAPGSGVLDRDSNASCVPDGKRQEDVVWSDVPTPGLYQVKVDMFSACGEAATHFVFKLYVSNELTINLPGRLLSIDADNGVGPGLAITNVQF